MTECKLGQLGGHFIAPCCRVGEEMMTFVPEDRPSMLSL